MSDLLNYRPAADLLRDRIILVTGAGGGIGRAVSIAAAAHGATVILLGRTVSALEQTYDSIMATGCPEPALYPLNLESAIYKDYETLADTLQREFGRLDGLVHAAALSDHPHPLAEHDPALWLRMLHVNLSAPFLLTQNCLPLLLRSNSASVIFPTDTPGSAAQPFWGSYGVSKAGLEQLCRIWAAELKNTPVRMNCLNPGPVRTTLRGKSFPAESSAAARPAEQVAPAFLYLLGRDSRDSGEILRLSQTPPSSGG